MEVSNAESFVKLKRRFPYRSIVIAFGDVAPELEQCLVARSAQNPFGVRPAAVGDFPVERPGPAGRGKGGEARLARLSAVLVRDVSPEARLVLKRHRHLAVSALEVLRPRTPSAAKLLWRVLWLLTPQRN